ncbi:metallophosphoesterase [Fundicoccus culcitae]|uniref:Metallophosphoesterase n=1 Tax=Fundicoccus culcitae TaxID=2969821 RepID=A0ABY5P3R0_9LACT|nr:metallophosphoesterase [Fundicoccus culcitae]UUX33368.1 metallophosphoesterase [Fundicoccus culcitae]
MTLMMDSNKRFRIAQLTDMHLTNFPFDQNDVQILHDVKKAVEHIEPDLIMITGDFVNSYNNENELEIVTAFFEFLNEFDIPKAITYGNHDTEHKLTRNDLEQLFNTLVSNKVSRVHEKMVDDRTQYVVEINSSEGSLARVLYVMDTGHVAPGEDKTNDWILREQVEWFRESCSQYKSLKNNLLFIHIPIPEYLLAKKNILSGALLEPNQLISTSRINTGLFSELFFSQQIYGVFCGHNHLNNAEMLWEDIHLFYGMFSGKEEKAGDFRGVRYIDLGIEGNTVSSDCVFFNDLVV